MPEETLFGDNEIKSLFQETTEVNDENILSTTSLFDIKDSNDEGDDNNDNDDLNPDGDDKDVPGGIHNQSPSTTSTKATPYGQGVQALIKGMDEFLIYEGDDERIDYTEDEFVALIGENVNIKTQKAVEATLAQILDKMSPTIQKVVTGELKGVKIKDIIADIQDFQEIEEIPENPDAVQKERIVKAYFRRQAKERNKDAAWAQTQLEKTINRGDLDDVFEDAKDFISQDLDNKIKEKEEAILKEKKEKEDFKRYHSHYVTEVLNEENLFGISLSKDEKSQVGKILATFVTRPSDNKEKLGLTAMIDNLIHNKNPKESYKVLALMALAGSAPDKLLNKLKGSAETQVTKETVRKLRTANTTSAGLAEIEKKEIKKLNNSIFN
jgi:hypothetical protein